MEFQTPELKPRPIIELTKDEYEARKLTRYGYFSSLLDGLYVALTFSAMTGISFGIIPGIVDSQVALFWYSFDIILFISAAKKFERFMNPLNFYQTIVIRK